MGVYLCCQVEISLVLKSKKTSSVAVHTSKTTGACKCVQAERSLGGSVVHEQEGLFSLTIKASVFGSPLVR